MCSVCHACPWEWAVTIETVMYNLSLGFRCVHKDKSWPCDQSESRIQHLGLDSKWVWSKPILRLGNSAEIPVRGNHTSAVDVHTDGPTLPFSCSFFFSHTLSGSCCVQMAGGQVRQRLGKPPGLLSLLCPMATVRRALIRAYFQLPSLHSSHQSPNRRSARKWSPSHAITSAVNGAEAQESNRWQPCGEAVNRFVQISLINKLTCLIKNTKL